MAKLTTSARKRLGAAVFGLPRERKFPMPDAAHAANAKARATQGVAKGSLSPTAAAKIRRKANAILGKGKTPNPKSAGHMMGSPGVADDGDGSI
jgi:hypothetical protein